MQYTILRNEKRKSREGEDEIFLQLEIATDDDSFQKALWLPKSDVEALNMGATTIDVVANRVATRAVLARPQQLADIEHSRQMELALAKAKA